MRGTLEKSLMFLICFDPIMCVVCGSIFIAIVGLRYFQIWNAEICETAYLVLHTPALVGVVANALVAVIRFLTIKE